MTIIKNISNDTLGWGGLTLGPGETAEVDREQAKAMINRHPTKWQTVTEGSKAHKHSYRKATGKCACGATKPAGKT